MDNERRWHLGVRAAGALAVVLALAGVMLVTVPSGEQADSPVTVSGGTTDEALLIEDLRDFDAWLEDRNGDGAQAARRRAESLRLLAETDPSRALMHAVSPRVKASLPGDVAEHVEDWIHGEATMEVLCPYPYTRAEVLGEEPIDTERVLRHERGAEYEHVLNFDGEAYQARVFGRRLGRVEKAKVPVSAIRLADGVVVVHGQPGLALSSEDAAWMATHDKETGSIRSAQPGVEVGNPDMVCPVSGEPASPDHAAMVGSKIYFFAAHRHIAAYNELLAEEEDHPSRRRFTNDATIGSLRTLVIIVDFSDGSPATTAANYELIMQTTNTFWNINSYGLSSYTDPIEYVTVSLGSKGSYSGCPISNGKSSTLDDDAWAQAALAGKNEGDYDRYLIVFEAYAACLWAGLGSIANTGTWINGLVDPVDHWHIAAHELGHNYGLKHANLWFGGATSPIGSGSSLPYGDDFDIMGAVTIDFDRSSFHVNVQKKNGLDWIPDSDVTDVTATGTYRVFAHDAIDYDDNVRGVKINQAGNKYYWIEYRQNIAYGPSADAFANGANIHWGYQTAGFEQETDLLDMTPAYVSDNLYDTAINNCPLQLATTFSDASNEIFITPTNKGSFFGHPYLDVFVYIGSNAGNNNPTADDITASCTTPEVDEPILLKIENVVDVDNDFLSYKWDFGDGSLNTVNAQQVSHAFSSTGSKTVTVIITDMRGGTATASTVTPIVVASSGSGSCPPCPNNCNGNGLCSGGATWPKPVPVTVTTAPPLTLVT